MALQVVRGFLQSRDRSKDEGLHLQKIGCDSCSEEHEGEDTTKGGQETGRERGSEEAEMPPSQFAGRPPSG